MKLTEVYRIIYKGPKDVLRGVIVVNDDENGYQSLLNDKEIEEKGYEFLFEEYEPKGGNISEMVSLCEFFYEEGAEKLSSENKPGIQCEDHILLDGPEASISDNFDISLYLFSACKASKGFHFPCREPKLQSTPMRTVIMGERGRRQFTVLYAMFGNAGEARVKVKFTAMKSAFHVYGIVSARTSAIRKPNYSSIIFFKDGDCDKITIGPGDEMILPLLRPVVAVPHGSKLILDINLVGDDKDDVLIRDMISFEAVEGVTDSDVITRKYSDKCVIEVGVSWRWTQKKPSSKNEYSWRWTLKEPSSKNYHN